MKTNRRLLCISLVIFAVFVLFTVLAKVCDVGPIGPKGEAVGFSHVNSSFDKLSPKSALCYKASQALGYLCLLVAAFNALLALKSLIKSKSLLKMDRLYLATMVLYAAVVLFYVLFEFVVINVRPTESEASYPSSHTMLALCVLYSTAVILRCKGEGKALFKALEVLCFIAMAAMVVLRLLSGVHWLTDIAAAIILSAALLTCYGAFTKEI